MDEKEGIVLLAEAVLFIALELELGFDEFVAVRKAQSGII
jgi:hypothetical protein